MFNTLRTVIKNIRMCPYVRVLVLSSMIYLVGCGVTNEPVMAQAFESSISFVNEGDTLRGTMFVAEGSGPRPTVLFFNGFVGFPQAPDFLAPVYEAGYNVLFFTYGGTWGSDGLFSIDRVLSDAQAALNFLRLPDTQAAYRIDGDAIAAFGISFGGWAALSLAAKDSSLECVAARVPANLGALGRMLEAFQPFRSAWLQNMRGLEADDSPVHIESSVEEVIAPIMNRANDYDLVPLASTLQDRTVILFGAEQDEVTPFSFHYQPVADALSETGMERLTLVTAPGGHQDPFPEWDITLVEWLRDDCFRER